MPYTVGLTGGIGSGKSTVGREFEALGIVVVDADAVAHQLTSPGGGAIERIKEVFGPQFIAASGALDRDRMRAWVFDRPEERKRLESILHPLIRLETARQADAAHSPYRILMIPLLVEARGTDPAWRSRFDRILVVDCAESTQIQRVMARNGFPEERVHSIMASQASRSDRLEAADDVIDNDDASQPLGPRVAALHTRYLELASQKAATRDRP